MGWFAAASLVFLNSAAILVIEIVAIRLMAPYVGVTLQTYTAIIGVVLAGISLGSWVGGRFADLRNPRQTLGPLLVVGGVLTICMLPLTRVVGELAQGKGSAMVLVLALISFFSPAAVLSAINPNVVKLQLEHLDDAGRIVGRVSGVGTAGAIFGTVITGFLLLAWLPTSTIVISLGVALIAGGAALIVRLRVGRQRRLGALVVLAALLAGGGASAARSPCQTETAYFCARVVRDVLPTGRVLVLDGLRHSYVDLADPTYLSFPYARRMADLFESFRPLGTPVRALWIGGGGFTLPRYLAFSRPGSSSVVLELDRNVVQVARERLGLVTNPRLSVRLGDARVLLREEGDDTYDLVVGDAYASRAVPWHLTTREFISDVHGKLRAGGVFTMNLIDSGPMRFVRSEVATLRSVFGYVALVARFTPNHDGIGENFVLFASDRPLPVAALAGRARARGEGESVYAGRRLARFTGDARPLRDDYAPVDRLVTLSNDGT